MLNKIQGRRGQKGHLFCAQTSPSLCFGLIFVLGKLTLANRSGFSFQKYMPLIIKINVAS